ncbi:hypothetical protein PQX77_022350 [Marasmius sp. AFHP31]|nr:hypothetical protein PQX77_022350 [Marasmius sp. AFHP31]
MSSSSSDITQTNPTTDWKYVSEGGATIVFSYVGPPNPTFDGMVLRLRKQPNVPVGVRDSDSESDGEESEDEDPSISFQRQCMSRLVPKEHLPKLQSVVVRADPVRSVSVDEVTGSYRDVEKDEEREMPGAFPTPTPIQGPPHIHSNRWLRALSKAHEHERPENRRKTGGVDVHKHKGVLATDLVGGGGAGGGVSVEIKPKWSFLPNPTHLSPSTRDIKTKTCRFCMHSYVRNNNSNHQPSDSTHHAQGLVAHGYCPLDLFSGDEERVRNALGALYDAWVVSEGKVNNLKVFLGGKVLKVHEKHRLWDPSEKEKEKDADDALLRTTFISSLLPLLTRTPALQVLNRLQRTLDMLDVEGLGKVWEAFHRHHHQPGQGVPELGEGMEEPTIDEWMGFIDGYLEQEPGGATTFLPGPPPSSTGEQQQYTQPQLRSFLLAYLLSATFKDCSIMVRMGKLGASDDNGDPDPRNVTIIDLDPKSMTRLRKWEVLDGEIVREYERLVALGEGKGGTERKVCVDAFGGGAGGSGGRRV